MDRIIVYSQQIPFSADFLQIQKNAVKALGQLASDLLTSASVSALLSGLACTATGPASMNVNLGAGAVYQTSALDPTTYGSLPIDNTSIFQQGVSAASQTLTGLTAPVTAGQSQAYLIQVQFAPVDGALKTLNFYNSANPTVPLIGPGGAGTQQNTTRTGALSVQVVAGTPATTGTQTTPGVTAGWLPAYVVTVANGQTTITGASIAVHGSAPFLKSLTSQHHLGLPGSAPKIDLTAEVSGQLPLANMNVLPTSQLLDLQMSQGAGLVANYNAGNPVINGTQYAITAGTVTVGASATTYVWVSAAGVVTQGAAFPTSAPFYPMAVIVAGASTLTSVTDKRTWQTGTASATSVSTSSLADLLCTAGAGLVLNYAAGNPKVNGTQYAITASSITLPASSTSYVWVSAVGVVTQGTTSFPATAPFYPLAVVVTGGAAITTVTDKRSWQSGTANTTNIPTTAFYDLMATAGAGLVLNYQAGNPLIGGAQFAIAASNLTLTASSTNFVFVNSAGAVTFNTTGFPTNTVAFFPIATVVTGGAAITTITDKRTWQVAAASAGAPTGLTVASFADLLVTATTGLGVAYAAGNPNMAGTVASISGGTLTLTASATNFVFVNSAGAVTFNTTGFPTTSVYFPMAVVVTGASTLTSITDKRSLMNGLVPNFADVFFGGTGKPTLNDKVLVYVATRAFTMPINLTGSKGYAETAATVANPVHTLYKNGSSIGSVTWSGSSPSFTFGAAVSFAVGDRLTVQNTTVDTGGNFQDYGITLAGVLS